ncbi:hypothetical protein CROQUDRAFT_136121 [Cronartium quercuum f. sp. fusiforme G11]|uniref:Uncharacterized protein n=1 Tax=Cronartium quercuum f. sp. fusiforme G11 TaxID=708437 RepID=A0A9P6NCV9_9BASI|nr:hypothetical protein CROQUDRAFT_136121 [Cronartium quercuum f. sp. fusiforme G11]
MSWKDTYRASFFRLTTRIFDNTATIKLVVKRIKQTPCQDNSVQDQRRAGARTWRCQSAHLYVDAQSRNDFQPQCEGKGIVNFSDCNLALDQFNYKFNGTLITDNTTKNSPSCSSCQLVLETTSPGNITILSALVKTGLQDILEVCRYGHGTIQLPQISSRPQDPPMKLTVIGGNGNVCQLPSSPDHTSKPENGSATKFSLRVTFSASLIALWIFFFYSS